MIMHSNTLPLLFAVLASSASAQLARRVDVDLSLSARATRPQGGYALIPEPKTFCSNELALCEQNCCPVALSSCDYNGGEAWICCPEGIDCGASLKANPYCADDTWNLWEATQGGINYDYFCCLPNLVGTLSGECVDPNTISSPTQEALELAPGGGVLSTSTVTGTISATTAITTIGETTTVMSSSTALSTVTSPSKSVILSSTTETATTKTTATSVAVESSSVTASSTSSSASASSTKTSGSESGKAVGSFWLVPAALAGVFGAIL